jgi:hypothetical protein
MTKRIKSREKRPPLTEGQGHYLRTGDRGSDPDVFLWAGDTGEVQAAWRSHDEDILDRWIAAHPGRRPFFWWITDAPEPRRLRVGGVGQIIPAYDIPANLKFGIPRRDDFICERLLSAWQKIGCTHGKKYHIYNEADPPAYESQATYLKRHKLLMPGEAKRLTDADFEAEVIR